MMQGKRVELVPQEGGFQSLNPGEYGRWQHGEWYGCTPNDHGCNLSKYKITEHEDGTITVSPYILLSDATGLLWHGYLERGVWREC
jgi:hypothetical protein